MSSCALEGGRKQAFPQFRFGRRFGRAFGGGGDSVLSFGAQRSHRRAQRAFRNVTESPVEDPEKGVGRPPDSSPHLRDHPLTQISNVPALWNRLPFRLRRISNLTHCHSCGTHCEGSITAFRGSRTPRYHTSAFFHSSSKLTRFPFTRKHRFMLGGFFGKNRVQDRLEL